MNSTEYLDSLVTKYGSRVFSMKGPKPSNAVYIGRGKGSILGNPFFTANNKTLEDRISNCIKYRRWIADIITTNTNIRLINQIKNLKDKTVVCWCSNGTCSTEEGAQYCHGHILLSLADHLNKEDTPAKEFINYSGGAYGGDTRFHQIALRYGITEHIHYRPEGNPNCSKTLRDLGVKAHLLSTSDLEYASNQVYNMIGIKYKPGSFGADLQLRNYYQIKDSEGVYAISKLNSDLKGVSGGTNTAVQLGIAKGILVYVLDTKSILWHMYNPSTEVFEVCTSIPILTKHWTGVGTREIQSYMKQDQGQWVNTPWCGEAKWKLIKAQIDNLFIETLKD